MMILYSDFISNFDKYKDKKHRIVGSMNNKIVYSCWRNTNYNDYATRPNEKHIKIIGVEIK